MTQAFPLQWPLGRSRAKARKPSRFDTGFTKARDGLVQELERLGARNQVLSSNLPLRLDGLPRAGKATDPGVAVYFTLKGKALCFSCDEWDRVEDNIHAISKTIDAMRGIARWGAGDMMDRAFSGFVALPAPGTIRGWREVLQLGDDGTLMRDDIERSYRALARRAHPDAGGSDAAMAELNTARDEALRGLAD